MLPGRRKFKNEMGAYLELLQMVKQALQKVIRHRAGPRLIRCLQEKEERKSPNADTRKRAKSVKGQNPIEDTRSGSRREL